MYYSTCQVYEMAHAFGSGLLDEGLKPGSKTIVGIYSANRVEVCVIVYLMLACLETVF